MPLITEYFGTYQIIKHYTEDNICRKEIFLFLTFSQTSPDFNVSAVKVFGKYCRGKREIARNEQFLLFPVFSTILENFPPFSKKFQIVVCKLFQFGRLQNLSFGKGLIVWKACNYSTFKYFS